MVTAELALAIPSVLVVLAMCLTGLALAVDQIRCVDAARVAARAAARGEATDEVVSLARRLAPEGASIEVYLDEARVVVEVQAPARGLVLLALPGARADAVGLVEPGARGAGR